MNHRKSPPKPLPVLQQALSAHARGDLVSAEKMYRGMLQQHPSHADACNLLGTLLHQTGRNDEALDYLHKAVQLMPGFADAHSNFGMVLRAVGRVDDAVSEFTRAIALKPGHWNARVMRAEAFAFGQAWEKARQDLSLALEANPAWTDGWCRMAFCYSKERDYESSVASLRKALLLSPDHPDICRDLGIALRFVGALDESVAVLQRAIDLAPGQARMSCQLAWTYLEAKRFVDAEAWFERALAEDGPTLNRQDALIGLGNVRYLIGLPEQALDALEEAKAIDAGAATLVSPYLSAQIYAASVSKSARYASHLDWASRQFPLNRPRALARATPPWRIGLVSGDLRNHAVARFLLSWLGRGDPSRFSYYAYSNSEVEDDLSGQLKGHFAGWRHISGLDDGAVQDAIAADQIDILIDLAGHTFPNRLAVFAQGAAPVQATWLGYPETTGLKAIDYRITDVWCDPPGEEAWAAEALARLPGGFICYKPAGEEAGATLLAPQREGFIFGCFNNLAKITPQVVSAFASILNQAPNSALLLKHFAYSDPRLCDQLRERFGALGVAADRLQLMPAAPSPRQHLEAYNLVDLALDTFPYNGTTTTCEALWMGVPLLGVQGERHAGRVGESILRQVYGDAADHALAQDLADYVARAVAAAAKGPRSLQDRQALRASVEGSSLMDGAGFATRIEHMFASWMADRSGAKVSDTSV